MTVVQVRYVLTREDLGKTWEVKDTPVRVEITEIEVVAYARNNRQRNKPSEYAVRCTFTVDAEHFERRSSFRLRLSQKEWEYRVQKGEFVPYEPATIAKARTLPLR